MEMKGIAMFNAEWVRMRGFHPISGEEMNIMLPVEIAQKIFKRPGGSTSCVTSSSGKYGSLLPSAGMSLKFGYAAHQSPWVPT